MMSGKSYLKYFSNGSQDSSSAEMESLAKARLIVPLNDISIEDTDLVGAKNASLGEMYNALSQEGVRVPNGFAITTEAYRYFLLHNQLTLKISRLLTGLKPSNLSQIAKVSRKIRHWICIGDVPAVLEAQIISAYRCLEEEYGGGVDVAVRGSSTLTYVRDGSTSGQQETYLNISGASSLLNTFRLVFSSLFTERAIIQRIRTGVDPMSVSISVGVQKMVRADEASSGVMTTLDPETGFRDVVFIAASFGLGDNLLAGEVEPDEFYVHKQKLAEGKAPIIKRELGNKHVRQIYAHEDGLSPAMLNQATDDGERQMFSLEDEEVLELARFAIIIEEHYSALAKKSRPMEIEWAKDGATGCLYIVQAKPESIQSKRPVGGQDMYKLKEPGWILASGSSIGNKIVCGKARVILHPSQMNRLREGEILVTGATDARWEPVLHRASAIVTERGSRSGHAAKFARRLGIPAIVGAEQVTQLIPNASQVTVSCRDRDDGFVYEGELEYSCRHVDYSGIDTTDTGLGLTLANPNHAFDYCQLPVNGVGLVKLEYIIWHNIGVHPRSLLQIEQTDSVFQQDMTRVCAAYGSRREYYVQRLTEGIAMVAAAFYPRPITVRFSDFKSDEYAALKGGELFEDHDANPLIGFRGAARFLSKEFAESFELECEAIRRVREDMGFDNTQVLIPFVRTVEESRELLDVMRRNGLERGKEGLRLLLMCETPANVLMASDFLEDYDGFMIGLDDLAQLTVGFDASSRKVRDYDECNKAVLKLVLLAARNCQEDGKYVGVCGLSDDVREDFLTWLVAHQVNLISVDPDNYPNVLETVTKAEARLSQLGSVSKLTA